MESHQIYGALLALLALAVFAFSRRPKANRHHRRMRRQADRALKTVAEMLPDRPGAVISYIRKLHPHAVEELVLSGAELAGHKVRRNARYTGDGGIDGMVEIAGCWHLIQVKRYSSAIDPAHVAAFNRLCEMRRMPGLFVSFGRTGPKSRSACGPQIRILSGDGLIRLLGGTPLRAVV